MSHNLHTGHGMNIRNFKQAIALSENFGQRYAPCNDQLSIPSMLDQLRLLIRVNEIYTIAIQQSKQLIAERDSIFKQLNKKITKLCGFAASLHEQTNFKKEVKELGDKIRGFRPRRLNGQQDDKSNDWNPALSYQQRTENFKKLIDLLSASPQYTPNEKSFRISYLYAEWQKMQQLNHAISEKMLTVHKARFERNRVLYDTETGVVSLMKACRNYIKALFGPGSKEYRQFSELKFRVLPKKYQSL